MSSRCSASYSALSYRLLRFIDPALVSFPLKTDAIYQAVEQLGIDNIRQIVRVLMISGIDDPGVRKPAHG